MVGWLMLLGAGGVGWGVLFEDGLFVVDAVLGDL